jgi:ribulose-5-phosphate 4-epimerase/fuculose-1-phosphate aldolase
MSGQIRSVPPAPVDQESALRKARVDLAAALQWAARMGLHEGVCNHFSLAVPGAEDRYLINPYGLHFSETMPDDLLIVDGAGHVIEGRYPLEPTAFFIHSRIHKARPDAACVLHTHMPYATALTMIEDGRLLMAHQNALRFFGEIAYDDDSGYQGLALDKAEGDRMVAALGSKRILFLENHGVIVVGPNVARTFDDLYYLERAAQHQVLAMSTGRPLKTVGHNIAQHTHAQMLAEAPVNAELHFIALKRMLAQEKTAFAA